MEFICWITCAKTFSLRFFIVTFVGIHLKSFFPSTQFLCRSPALIVTFRNNTASKCMALHAKTKRPWHLQISRLACMNWKHNGEANYSALLKSNRINSPLQNLRFVSGIYNVSRPGKHRLVLGCKSTEPLNVGFCWFNFRTHNVIRAWRYVRWEIRLRQQYSTAQYLIH